MEDVNRRNQADGEQHRARVIGIREVESTDTTRAVTISGSSDASLEIDTSIYSKEAILRAVYKFTDRCYVVLRTDTERLCSCKAHFTSKTNATDIVALCGEFANELVDQQLRVQLEAQFGAVRSVIVAQAFAEGNLLDRDRDEDNYETDPHGIGSSPR